MTTDRRTARQAAADSCGIDGLDHVHVGLCNGLGFDAGVAWAGSVSTGTTVTEWNVYDEGLAEVYLQPWADDRTLAEEYVESGRYLICRQRTGYADLVTEWTKHAEPQP